MWTGCPAHYVAPEATNYVSEHDELGNGKSPSETSFASGEEDEGMSSKTDKNEETVIQTKNYIGTDDQDIETSVPKATPEPLPSAVSNLKEDLLLEAELAELALAEERLDKLKKVRERKMKAEEDFLRLSRQSQGEGARNKTMIDEVNSLRSKNSQPKVSRRDHSSYRGPVIDDMRKDTRTRQDVEQILNVEVHNIPSLSNASSSTRGQPRLKVAATPHIPVDDIQSRWDSHSQPEHQPHPAKEQHYRWETGVDRHGVEYRTLVEVTPVKSVIPDQPRTLISMGDGWVYDEETGRAYRSSSLSQPTPPLARHPSRAVNTQSRYRAISTPPRQGRPALRSPYREKRNQSDVERYSDRGNWDSTPCEREGKAVSIADHARMMPLECARSVTSKNINFAMFMYGAIKELHSARIGQSTQLNTGVLEAKLQHLLNVIHVTLLNSTSSDFKPVAWSVGRTYNSLVQAKLDGGRESWLDFDQLHRGSPHASKWWQLRGSVGQLLQSS